MLIRDSMWNSLGVGARIATGLAVVPALSRGLGTSGYGLWVYIQAMMALASIPEAGIAATATVRLSHREFGQQNATDLVSYVVIVAGFAGMALWLTAGVAAKYCPIAGSGSEMMVKAALEIGGSVVAMRLAQQAGIMGLQVRGQYRTASLIITVQALCQGGSLIILGLMGESVVALASACALSGFAGLAVTGFALARNGVMPKGFPVPRAVGKIVMESLPVWGSSIGGSLFSIVDRFVVGAIAGASGLGTYAVVANTCAQINSLSAVPVQPVMPTTASATTTSSLRAIIYGGARLNVVSSLSIGGGLLCLSPEVIGLLSPQSGPELKIIFCLGAVLYSLYSLNAVGYYTLLGRGKSTSAMWIQCSAGLASILLVAILTPKFGILGAVAGAAGYQIVWKMNIVAFLHAGLTWQHLLGVFAFPICSFLCLSLVAFSAQSLLLRLVSLTLFLACISWWCLARKPPHMGDNNV